jgi:hypothetical protein
VDCNAICYAVGFLLELHFDHKGGAIGSFEMHNIRI